jgi:hypothetical protein
MPNQAQKDLNRKLQLEAKLRTKIDEYNNTLAQEFARVYGLTGQIINARRFDTNLEAILLPHYEEVGKTFSDDISSELPEDVAVTLDERARIERMLGLALLARAPRQAGFINDTTNENAEESLLKAQQVSSESVLAGQGPMSQLETAAIAGSFLASRLTGRAGGIVALETEAPAELAKLTEVSVLTESGPFAVAEPVQKKWMTVGDSHVRDAHRAAQFDPPVNADEPFMVGGELLMYPGDTSLGASIENVANCRCSAIFNTGEIISARRG